MTHEMPHNQPHHQSHAQPSPSQDAPWPRFTAPDTPPGHEARPRSEQPSDGREASWARWGSLPPRETPRVAYAPPAPAPAATEAVPSPASAPPPAPPAPEAPPQATPPETSRALVPVRIDREMTLADLGHAARRAAPVVAVAGLAVVAASMLFRRR